MVCLLRSWILALTESRFSWYRRFLVVAGLFVGCINLVVGSICVYHQSNKRSLGLFFLYQPWRTLCGFPPNQDTISLLIPNGRWRPDTVITDVDGNEFFVLLDLKGGMGSYEAVFGDLEGRRLVCVKRHICRQFWRDGYYFCTYYKNYPGQRALKEKDCEGKKVYPFSYLEFHPMKGMFFYREFDDLEQLRDPRLIGQNPWLGFMLACCTPLLRFGNFACSFHKARSPKTVLEVDQWTNTVIIGPGNDMLAALCIAYVFDKCKCQPMVTVVGGSDDDDLEDPDDASTGGGDYDFYEDQAQQARAAQEAPPAGAPRNRDINGTGTAAAASGPDFFNDGQQSQAGSVYRPRDAPSVRSAAGGASVRSTGSRAPSMRGDEASVRSQQQLQRPLVPPGDASVRSQATAASVRSQATAASVRSRQSQQPQPSSSATPYKDQPEIV